MIIGLTDAEAPASLSCLKLFWKFIAEHRQAALGLGAGGFVLEDVPVLGEPTVLDTDDVGGDPCGRP